jgi:tripartite-type tricarboxylate transporter receptor subunit TctC
MIKRANSILLVTVFWFLLFTINATAEFPEKAIKYYIGFNPGGESDLTARAQQKPLEEILGEDILIKYKIGGGGETCWSKLVQAKSDGYTVAGFNLPHIILQPLFKDKLGYATKDIKVIFIFEFTPNILAVRRDSQFKTLEQFVNYAKENPGIITIGGSGSFSANHLGTLEFNQAADIKTTYIPFTGSGEAVPALLGKHVTGLMTYTTMGVRHSDEMRVLAVAAEERVPAMPDVPTFKELGYDYIEGAYRGLAAPPGTPDDVVQKLAEANLAVNEMPSFKNKLQDMGFQIINMGPEESEEFIEERFEYYKKVLAKLNIKIEKNKVITETNEGIFLQTPSYRRDNYAWE